MTSTLRYEETDRKGSFMAWGAGFFYGFSGENNLLSVHVKQGRAPLLNLELNQEELAQVRPFIHYFDKAAQVRALMLSNHHTIELSRTMEVDRLRGVLNSISLIANYACALDTGNLAPFIQQIKAHYDLQHFNIKHLCCQKSGEPYYRARLRTHSENEAVARSITVHGVLLTLSEKVTRDLIALEFGTQHHIAHKLLSFSSQIATISRVLNGSFYPALKIREPKPDQTAKEHSSVQ